MDIFEEIIKLRKAGRKGALATIIQVQGSIPSYESSKILIRDDGSIVGTVGGGCVEAEVWSVAQDVTRGHKGDLTCLRWALKTPARYVGMIGSRRKFIEISKVLESEGVPPERLERVFSPIGLDVGAITPEEIAVAVVAEMIAVRRNA